MKHRSPSAKSLVNAHSFVTISSLPKLLLAYPISLIKREDETVKSHLTPLTSEQYWYYIGISTMLVLLGGVFAGLTLGLMGQDEVYLKVISSSGEPVERKNAKKVLQLIDRGKHWVLVTLLLSNVITNETLPIVLDRVLGGGWPAVVSSTASIVIFGEVIPQSLCVRYGLQIGAFFTPFVLTLMYVMYPIAYPIALLLDKILGEDHGTIYKKSGLKTLVTLHRTMGVERLNNDEVTIISAVLDLKEKRVREIMTPIENVYTMASDRILDEKTVEEIFNSGFSRIPIYLPDEPTNFIGMLLVRVLISYDPEDALPVSSFPLATLPETPPETSCLNILNYFQEGKSHMVVVSENPGDSVGAIGVLTLEDVIEELIGEEIVDESDVFVDIHKAIKRDQPGPLSKRHLTQYLHTLYTNSNRNSLENRSNSHLNDETIQFKPSNLASDPLETTKSFVTIKKQPQPKRPSQFSYFDDEPNSRVDAPLLSENGNGVATNSAQDVPLTRSDSPNYGSNDRPRRPSRSTSSISHYKKFQIPTANRDSTDLSDYVKSNEDARNDITVSTEQHSYRTGGIIESVVNHQGVSKTIIEATKDYDDDKGHDHSADETRGLIIHQ